MKGFFSKHKGNNFADNRTYIEGELAIKPYYYFRNGHLHVRYNVDRAIELSEAEFPKCIFIGSNAFYGCSNLTNINISSCSEIL